MEPLSLKGKTVRFLHHDIWRINVRQLPRRQYILLRILRIFALAIRSFDENKCQLRASALTYFSLLSIVPVLAMAFGIAQGFGLEASLNTLLIERLRGQGEVVNWIIQFAHSLLQNTQGGLVAGVGIAVLFWSVIQLLGNIENAFNDIWGVKQARSLGRKLSDYLSMMLICPVLLIMSSSLTVFITSQVTMATERVTLVSAISPLIMLVLNLLPYAVVWMLFTFIYILMPNTKVSIKAGIVAGVIAGSIYQIVQWGYVTFQIGVARVNAIYGSFAALPLFLAWLQTSWLIVLFGAEISFALDNERTYEQEPESLETSLRFRRLLALRIVEMAVTRFIAGEPPLRAIDVTQQSDAPIRLVREILYDLVRAKVLVQLAARDGDEEYYQPGQDPERLTVHGVLHALETLGHDDLSLARGKELEKLAAKLAAIDKLVAKSPENVPLKQL